MEHVVEGDDSVTVPAPPLEYLGHRPAAHAPSARMQIMQARSLEGKRTAIPVLLTAGMLFIIAGTLKFLVGPESPLYDFPIWMPLVLFGLSIPMLTLAALNMLQVRSIMAEQAAKTQVPGG